MLAGAVWAAARGDSTGAAALSAGLALGAFVNYVALVRPSMRAYEDHLLVRNMLSDTEVPWHLVDGVAVRQTTRIHVDGDVLHAVGIGRSARSVRAEHRGAGDRSPGVLGVERLLGMSTEAVEAAGSRPTGYPDYVQTRLADLVTQLGPASVGRTAVRHRWAVPETAALVVLTVLFALLAVLAWLG